MPPGGPEEQGGGAAAAYDAVAPSEPGLAAVPHTPGRLVELYDVQKAVGKGGYAVVYKGVRRQDGRIIAVKRVEIFEMTPKKRERCLQEVTLLSQLNHPYIIQMLDAFIDENMLIIIFEWAPAGDLKRLIKKTAEAGKTLDEPAIWGLFSQIVDALRYMHAHRIMHRDIKPANVLVGANGALKLGDLGLGRQLSEQTMEAFSKVGTPYYVSPEVVRGAGYDWKSDVWSMGCLLYELACLRSPFEMEGANLYDVFQKISKGEYEPLPADMFSPTLRSLVVRMLQVDPARRPELEEVWATTQSIVQGQSRSRQDIHVSSETIYSQLLLLEAECNASARGEARGSTSGGGKGEEEGGKRGGGSRGSSRRAAAVTSNGGGPQHQLPAPPHDTLRLLHAAYFAEPLGGMPGYRGTFASMSDDAQKQQLGTFLHIFAWLLRVGGWSELAQPVEAQLEMRPVPGRRSAAPSAGAPGGSSGSAGGPSAGAAAGAAPAGSKGSRGRSSTAARAAAAPAASGGGPGGANGLSPSPPPPPACIPVCANLLRGAEAAKKSAQGAGISTEFSPVTALAAGHGRAVCSLLQDMLEATAARVPVVARRPVRQKEPEPGGGDGDGEDGLEEEAGLIGVTDEDDGSLLTAASPMPPAFIAAEDEELAAEEGGTIGGTLWEARLQPPPAGPGSAGGSRAGTPGASQGRGSTGGAGGSKGGKAAAAAVAAAAAQARRAPILLTAAQQVDPEAWRMELERLAPQLSRIKVSAAALGGGGAGVGSDWAPRWDSTKASLRIVQSDAPPAVTALSKVAAAVTDDLERAAVTERRLNSDPDISNRLQHYRASRKRLEELQGDVAAHEDLQQAGHAALQQLADQMESLQQAMAEKAADLDGSSQVKQMQDAIRKLRKEMGGMELRIGVVQQELARRQRKHLQQLHTLPSGEDDEEEGLGA